MDWPYVTKYRGVVSAQTHREEIIQDLYNTHEDPVRGKTHSGIIRYWGHGIDVVFLLRLTVKKSSNCFSCLCFFRELLRAFRLSTKTKPERIIFYRLDLVLTELFFLFYILI